MIPPQADVQLFQFHIWERLKIVVGDEGKQGYYASRLADIRADRLVISRPHYERGESLLADNRRVTVYCTRADAAYCFSARLQMTGLKQDNEMYLVKLGTVRRLQRRRFVRLDLAKPVKYMVLPRPLTDEIDLISEKFIPATTINLSAGGLLVGIRSKISVGTLLVFSLERCRLKHLPPYILAACRHVQVTEDRQMAAGIEFILNEDLSRYLTEEEMPMIPDTVIQFDDRMQNQLVSELFAEQLVMRQKGLL